MPTGARRRRFILHGDEIFTAVRVLFTLGMGDRLCVLEFSCVPSPYSSSSRQRLTLMFSVLFQDHPMASM